MPLRRERRAWLPLAVVVLATLAGCASPAGIVDEGPAVTDEAVGELFDDGPAVWTVRISEPTEDLSACWAEEPAASAREGETAGIPHLDVTLAPPAGQAEAERISHCLDQREGYESIAVLEPAT